MKYFITTDTHFGHKMLIEHKYRISGYEDLLFKNLSKVTGDVLIHLGDICIGNDLEWNTKFLEVAKKNFKKVILVRGNHDGKSYSWYYDKGWDFVCETMRLRYLGKELLFSHMPVLAEDSKYGLYHDVNMNIHGHLHGNGNYSHRAIDGYDSGFHYDCAPDTHEMKPVPLAEILLDF